MPKKCQIIPNNLLVRRIGVAAAAHDPAPNSPFSSQRSLRNCSFLISWLAPFHYRFFHSQNSYVRPSILTVQVPCWLRDSPDGAPSVGVTTFSTTSPYKQAEFLFLMTSYSDWEINSPTRGVLRHLSRILVLWASLKQRQNTKLWWPKP